MAAGCAGVAARLESPPQLPDPSDLDGWRARIANDRRAHGLRVQRPGRRGDDRRRRAARRRRPRQRDHARTAHAVGDAAPVYLDIHGGALVAGGGEACRLMNDEHRGTRRAAHLGRSTTACRPTTPTPPPLDDCLAVYRALLEDRRPSGSSSAAARPAATWPPRCCSGPRTRACRCRPRSCCCHPEVDLTESGDTLRHQRGRRLRAASTASPTSIALYAGDHDLAHPLPLAAVRRPHRLPAHVPAVRHARPLPLQHGAHAPQLRDAGVDAELHVWEAMPHGGFFGAPEDAEIGVELRRFLARRSSHQTAVESC